MKSRISTDLGDPIWVKLLKAEAQRTDSSMKDVMILAFDSYLSHRWELRALERAASAVFEEWDDPRDSDYDKL